MKSRITKGSRKCFTELPPLIQKQAPASFLLFRNDPNHPGLRFKKVHRDTPVFSVRVSREYRALGVLESDTIVWFWIGSHDEYERLISWRRGGEVGGS